MFIDRLLTSADVAAHSSTTTNYLFNFSVDDLKSCHSNIITAQKQKKFSAPSSEECTSNFPLSLCYAGLSAFTGEGSNSSGPEGRSDRRGQEQERRCDQGEMCLVVSVAHPLRTRRKGFTGIFFFIWKVLRLILFLAHDRGVLIFILFLEAFLRIKKSGFKCLVSYFFFFLLCFAQAICVNSFLYF